MKNLVRFWLSILLVASISYDWSKLELGLVIPSALAETSTTNRGLIKIASPYDVQQTTDRLERIIQEKGLTLFTRIDHSAGATKIGLELNPTQLLIFGNPQGGTPLMQCSITTGIDLPLKFLVYQDESQQTQIVYNQPEYLQQRHQIEGCDEVLGKIDNALQGIVEAAIQ